MSRKRPPLLMRPPTPRSTAAFVDGAEAPREPSRPNRIPAGKIPAREAAGGNPWGVPERETEPFLLRMPGEMHAMLAWLSEVSGPRRHRVSMNALITDLLRGPLGEAVRRRRAELGE